MTETPMGMKPSQPSATMHLDMSLKAKLYVLLSIAVLFIAIIPAKYVSGIFEQDTTVFIISLAGFIVLLEFIVWCCLNGPWAIYEVRNRSKANESQPESSVIPLLADEPQTPTIDGISPAVPIAETTESEDDDATSNEEASTTEAQAQTSEQPAPATDYLQLYNKGCDDYFTNQAEAKKQQLVVISEYIHYIMAPFISQDRMEGFCHEILAFATNPDYKPQPFLGLKHTLNSFDVRHLVWNVVSRLGLGKGKPYSVDICTRFIMAMFPDLCEGLDRTTLKNLKVKSASDKIEIDETGSDGISFRVLREKK